MTPNSTILYTKIADYNRIMQSTVSLQVIFKTVTQTYCDNLGGELETPSADTLRVCFKNPVNAIQFAKNILDRFSQEPRVSLKTGISFYNREKVADPSGDPIAFNLAQIGPEGAILVTEDIYESLKYEKDIEFTHIGRSLFKGMESPAQIYALSKSGFYIPSQQELSPKMKHEKAIAVLPFHNSSSERELDYICDGLAEEIIDRLTQSKELFVTARSSSFMFRNQSPSILEISRKLNVSYVLDGSIRKRNQEYRISYQLVDCTTGYNILSNTLSSNFDNLYAFEKQISEDILEKLDIGSSDRTVDSDYYLNPDAYEHYLKGRHLAYQWSAETSKEAIMHYKKALEIFPGYSLAYSGLSICLMHSAINHFIDLKEGFQKASEYADKAIEADKNRHEGYLAKALVSFWIGNGYLPDFEENIKKALNISPSNAEIRMFYGMLFLYKGDTERALIELKLANSLDPYSLPVITRMGLVQYLRKEYEEAYNTFLISHKIPNYNAWSSIRLAWCCVNLNQYNRALEYLQEAQNDHPYFNMVLSSFLVVYYHLKDEENFFFYKSKIEDQDESDSTWHYNQAILNKLLDRPEKAIYHISKTLEDHVMRLAFVQLDEFWEDYRDMPEFKSLVENSYGAGNKGTVRIESETSEYMDLDLNEFLYAEAQDNYTAIVCMKGKQKKERILRATLSSVEKQMQLEGIYRCHRSFLVKCEGGFQLNKSDNRARLRHPELDVTIPVSRSHEKEFRELFSNM